MIAVFTNVIFGLKHKKSRQPQIVDLKNDLEKNLIRSSYYNMFGGVAK